mmetsp:Transcript_15258/g.57651  ORF Transcript_15258/g.57651 Transcript_15258/m.57651 type:complete len:291 (+) Transcript_15258:1034-1906(+)
MRRRSQTRGLGGGRARAGRGPVPPRLPHRAAIRAEPTRAHAGLRGGLPGWPVLQLSRTRRAAQSAVRGRPRGCGEGASLGRRRARRRVAAVPFPQRSARAGLPGRTTLLQPPLRRWQPPVLQRQRELRQQQQQQRRLAWPTQSLSCRPTQQARDGWLPEPSATAGAAWTTRQAPLAGRGLGCGRGIGSRRPSGRASAQTCPRPCPSAPERWRARPGRRQRRPPEPAWRSETARWQPCSELSQGSAPLQARAGLGGAVAPWCARPPRAAGSSVVTPETPLRWRPSTRLAQT